MTNELKKWLEKQKDFWDLQVQTVAICGESNYLHYCEGKYTAFTEALRQLDIIELKEKHNEKI